MLSGAPSWSRCSSPLREGPLPGLAPLSGLLASGDVVATSEEDDVSAEIRAWFEEKTAPSGQAGRRQDDTFTQAGRALIRFHHAATFGRSVMRSPTFDTTRHWRYGIHAMSASE